MHNESRFQLLNAARRLKIWCQIHEAMDSACQVGTVSDHDGSIRGVSLGNFQICWYFHQLPSIRFGTVPT